MKKKILTLITFFALVIGAIGQTTDQCGTTLDPTTDPSLGGSWDWRTNLWDMRYNGIPCDGGAAYCGQFSPFYDTYSQNILKFSNFDINNPSLRDYHPENGWELISRKLGNPFTGQFVKDNPYVILYNKYTGILRVFVYMTQQGLAYNGAAIKLTFLSSSGTQRMTGLLSKWNSKITPLDQFDKLNGDNKLISMIVPNYFANNPGYWLHADFQTMYDPCTCGFQSTLYIQPKLVQTTNVQLDIKGTITPEGAVTENGKIGPEANTGSSNSLSEVTNGLHSVSKAFKSSENAINTISKWAEKQNPKATTKKFETLKAYKQWQEDTYGNVDLENLEYEYNSGKVSGTFKVINVASKAIKFLGIASKIAKYIPYIGQGLGMLEDVINMFSGGGQNQAETPKPVVQMVDLKAKGTFTLETTPNEIFLNTPGSANSTQSQYINPEYNNVLGVFNLMETPKLKFKDVIPSLNSPNLDPFFNCFFRPGYCNKLNSSATFVCLQCQKVPSIRVFRLEDDIKYLINPASGLEVEKIEGALLFSTSPTNAHLPTNTSFQRVLGPVMAIDYKTDYQTQLDKYGYEVESWSGPNNEVFNGVFRTRFVPIGSLKNLVFALYDPEMAFFDINLKLRISFKKIMPDGSIKRIDQMFTFKTGLGTRFPSTSYTAKVIPNMDVSEKGSVDYEDYLIQFNDSDIYKDDFVNNYSNIQERTVLNNTIPSGNFTAINTLTLLDATYRSTSKSTFLSGNTINIVDETVLTGEASFQIGDVLGTSRQVPPQNVAQIATFCSSSKYNSAIPANAAGRFEEAENDVLAKSEVPLSAYPNPVLSSTTISYSLLEKGSIKLYVMNSLGQKVEDIVNVEDSDGGVFEKAYSSQNLSPGIYILVLEANGKKETIKLVVTK